LATWRRISVSRSVSRGVSSPVLPQHEPGQAGGEHRVAGGGAAHRVQELVPVGRLEQVAGRPGLHRVEDVLLLAAGRQHQHPYGRIRPGELPRHLDAADVWQLQVDDGHVWPYGIRDPDGLGALPGGRHHIETRVGQVACHRIAPDGVVIDHQHADSGIRHEKQRNDVTIL
jgi:hypothetical protein